MLPSGTLYVVATPIGNIEDISPRAIQALKDADTVASEDTRTVGVFLSRLGIDTRQISLFEGNEARRSAEIIDRLNEGLDVALVCESGTPGISDPGQLVVDNVLDAGLTVVPIPGPCAAVAALSASGLPSNHFFFEGFLPKQPGRRRRRMRELADQAATLIFYESPRRLARCLADLCSVLGPDRRAAVARELSKVHEEIVRSRLGELASRYDHEPPRGEITLLVEGAGSARITGEEMDRRIRTLMDRGEATSMIGRKLSGWSGWSRNEVYRRALDLADSRT